MAPELVLWDWNGTLLDDVALCVDLLNKLLADHGYPQRYTLHAYRNLFGFPIEEYYRRAGFDFSRHPFSVLAQRYMDLYIPQSEACGLSDGAQEALALLHGAGVRQVILSASPNATLRAQAERCGVAKWFDRMLGLDDILGKSKVELGLSYLRENRFDPTRAVMIGDSVHDAEVAKALGTRCVLQSAGHQAAERLRSAGVPVVENVKQAAALALKLC